MRILPLHLEAQIQQFDPSIYILWNRRLNRWVVVQKVNKWMAVTEKLRGCAAIQGEKTQYKTMFVCELENGLPVEPGPWIVRRLVEACPQKQEAKRIDEMEKKREEAERRAFQCDLEAVTTDLKSDLRTYSSQGKARKHVVIGY